jgi:hypothetical protein
MLDFDRLWNAYPNDPAPCQTDGSANFPNQCAIRFGLALIDGGVNMSKYKGVHCWFAGHGARHLLRGEELAAFMRRYPAVFGQVEIKKNVNADAYHGRKGLIFCRNFWGPGNQGDHIDLWKLNMMRSGAPAYIERSEEVWFWQIEATTMTPALARTLKPKTKGRS